MRVSSSLSLWAAISKASSIGTFVKRLTTLKLAKRSISSISRLRILLTNSVEFFMKLSVLPKGGQDPGQVLFQPVRW